MEVPLKLINNISECKFIKYLQNNFLLQNKTTPTRFKNNQKCTYFRSNNN